MLCAERSQDLAIDSDAGLCKGGDQFGVGGAVQASSGVDLDIPERAELTFLLAAVAQGHFTGMEHGWASKTDKVLASPHVAFYPFKQVFSAFYVLCTSFYAWHIIKLSVWHQDTNGFTQGVAKGDIAALVARGFAGFTGIKVVLTGLALQDFPGARDLDALRHRFVGLQFHTGGL